jgi:dTDP-4-amino-4,6-dideoxygalactose transaminase
MMKVPYVDIAEQFFEIEDQVMLAIQKVLSSGKYIMSEQVSLFEKNFREFCQCKYSFGVANGTDALIIAMKALGVQEGDEVITPANSWVSSTSSITICGATPVFADIGSDLQISVQEIEKKITSKTKVIMPVHLAGKMANMKAIMALAEKHQLFVIEDAAQAVGASYEGQAAGTIGDIGCFSLHPLKNLNAAGDAGVITTNNKDLAQKIALLRQHGLASRNDIQLWGYNSRLDEIQAAILNCKFVGLPEVLDKRHANAELYRSLLCSDVVLPDKSIVGHDANHLFVIQCKYRDELKEYLKTYDISSAIHYEVPIHLQPAAHYLGYEPGDLPETELSALRILSLPIHQHLTNVQISFVAEKVNEFFKMKGR